MSLFSQVEKAIEREFRKWTVKAFGAAESDELVMVYRKIREEIENKVVLAQRGKRIFPYNHVVVRLVSSEADRRAIFDAAFRRDSSFEKDVRQCLIEARCEIPPGFCVEIEIAETGPKNFEIFCDTREASGSPQPESPVAASGMAVTQGSAAASRSAQIAVLRGQANHERLPVSQRRINIGRLTELTDFRQRVIRRNDLVFAEGADEANTTVSRSHAHIRFDAASREYRICDDGSEYGTRIFRDGRSIEVPAGGQRGERLHPGDEIYLGRACIRFEME